MSDSTFAIGLGIGTQNKEGTWLEVFYPSPLVSAEQSIIAAVKESTNYEGGNATLVPDESDLNCPHLLCFKWPH